MNFFLCVVFLFFFLGSRPLQLEDATFQVYKDGDYGNYLDVEATLNEQAEELEGFLEKYVRLPLLTCPD